MNKTVFGVIITIVAIGAIVGVVAINNKDESGSSSSNNASMEQMDMTGIKQSTESNGSEQETGQAKTSATVVIKDFAFGPKNIKVKKGAIVTWKNQDTAKHDITPDSESADFKASQQLAKGEDYSFTFNKAGKYPYHCSPHPYMKASVEVVE